MDRQLITPTEAAKRLKTTEATLSRWRSWGKGPVYFKFGRRYWYDVADLEAFIVANRIETDNRAA